jgi:hypothetical protein
MQQEDGGILAAILEQRRVTAADLAEVRLAEYREQRRHA